MPPTSHASSAHSHRKQGIQEGYTAHSLCSSSESVGVAAVAPRPVAAGCAASCSVCGHRCVAHLFTIQHLARTLYLAVRCLQSRPKVSILPLNARTAKNRVLVGIVIARGAISSKRFCRGRFCIDRASRYVVRLRVRVLIRFCRFLCRLHIYRVGHSAATLRILPLKLWGSLGSACHRGNRSVTRRVSCAPGGGVDIIELARSYRAANGLGNSENRPLQALGIEIAFPACVLGTGAHTDLCTSVSGIWRSPSRHWAAASISAA